MTKEQSDVVDALFPAGLLEWAGHRKGGVRKPFFDGSGRPCTDVIQTPLLARLLEWVKSIGAGETVAPKSIFLVGGPGNGKTEAIEQVLGAFDEALHCHGDLISAFASQFSGDGQHSSPRVVKIKLGGGQSVNLTEIAVVQDASMRDPAFPNMSEAELFISDVKAVLEGGPGRIYLACVNRGILDDALMVATARAQKEVQSFLETIIRSIELTPDSPSCWPLQGFPNTAVWPMDVETLLGTVDGNLLGSPAGQVLYKVLDSSKWPASGTCPAGEKCPFCGSHEILKREIHRESFLRVLRWTELALGKRWSFRDLFSLYSYLFAGAAMEGGQDVAPCEWAARLDDMSRDQTTGSSVQRMKAPFLLATALYQHSLFGIWPRLNPRSFRKAISDLGMKEDPGIMGLFYFLTTPRGASIPATLQTQLASLGDALDPALADPSSTIQLSSRTITLSKDIDARFSQSIQEGLNQCRRQLHPLEVELLQILTKTDERLSSSTIRQQHPATSKRIQNLIRDFACRLVRRSLGVRFGIVRDKEFLIHFQQVVERNPQLVHKAVKQVEGLLNEHDRFFVSLNSTFGEPVLPPARRAVLSTPKQKVKAVDDNVPGRPTPVLRFLRIGNGSRAHILPLTYELFRAVRELESGMLPASLPRSVVALLDTSRAKLAGAVVRDEDLLDDAELRLGVMKFVIRRELGQFVVSRDDV